MIRRLKYLLFFDPPEYRDEDAEFVERWLTQDRLSRLVIWLTLLVTAANFASVGFGWPELASRFGSLLVACGLGLDMFVVGRIQDRRLEQSEDYFADEVRRVSHDTSWRTLRSAFPDRKFKHEIAETREIVREVRRLRRGEVPFQALAFVVVLIGTLMWGFGDWLVIWLHGMNGGI